MPEKLTPEEVSIAAQAVGCPVADVHASAPIRLYKCPQSQREWKYTGHCGIATVHFDTSINVVYIRVTDLRTKTVVYEQEGYEGFIFEKQSPFFYAFESDDHLAGFCFAEEFDAAAFALKVTGLMNISKQAAMVSAGAKKAPATGSAPKSPTTKAPEHQKSQSGGSSGGGITGLFSGIFKGKNAAPAAATKKPVIGKVKSFKHVAHLGFSATEGFGEIPPEWRKIFNQAGLSDEDLKDKKTAAFVMKTIVAATHDAPPPPPPPPSNTASRPAPPAPPVSRGAPAPPPPPPQVSNLSPSAPAPPPPPPVSSAGSGSQDLMSMIKSTKLKKVTESDIPKVEEMDESQQTDLAKKIAMAMEMRRSHMQDSDDEEDDDWEM